MSIMASNDDPMPIEPGERLLVGHAPATELRVVDVSADDGRPMASIEAGRHNPVRYRTPVREVADKLERGRYRRVESC